MRSVTNPERSVASLECMISMEMMLPPQSITDCLPFSTADRKVAVLQ